MEIFYALIMYTPMNWCVCVWISLKSDVGAYVYWGLLDTM